MEFVEQYFWQIMALLGSPYCGFAAGQRYKKYMLAVGQRKTAFFDMKVMNVSGLITYLFTFACWYQIDHDLAQSVIIAGMIGVAQLSIVKLMIAVLKRRAPELAEDLSTGEDTTYLPWVKRRKS